MSKQIIGLVFVLAVACASLHAQDSTKADSAVIRTDLILVKSAIPDSKSIDSLIATEKGIGPLVDTVPVPGDYRLYQVARDGVEFNYSESPYNSFPVNHMSISQ